MRAPRALDHEFSPITTPAAVPAASTITAPYSVLLIDAHALDTSATAMSARLSRVRVGSTNFLMVRICNLVKLNQHARA
jgi:hypothetical protein